MWKGFTLTHTDDVAYGWYESWKWFGAYTWIFTDRVGSGMCLTLHTKPDTVTLPLVPEDTFILFPGQ